MKSTESKILECGTPAEELVSYLYGEAGDGASVRFEEHLLECDTCTNEFASLSLARLEVYEWHRDEFAEMPTPRIAVPYDQVSPARSWFSGLSTIFGWKAGFTAGGLAAATVAIMIGGWFMFLSEPSGVGMARIDNSNASIAEGPELGEAVSVPQLGTEERAEEIPAAEPQKSIRASAPAPAAPSRASKPVVREPKGVRAQPASVQAQRRSAPRLNGTEDETDTTLRLADLLAEIDTDE